MLSRVDDPSDARIAPYRDVGDHDALRRRGVFVAEGRLVVRRLVEDARFSVESVLVTPAAYADMQAILEPSAAPVFVCAPDVLSAVAKYDFHRGCLALARRPAAPPAVETLCTAGRLLVLEGVGNPDNVGGIFRSALALGAAGVILDERSADPLYRKAIRTSMAATLRVPFARAPLAEALPILRARGFRLVALTPSEEAVDLRQVAWTANAALLLGSEGDGLSDDVLGSADVRARIPIDPVADSLNVAVAAAIALYVSRAAPQFG
jgi:tRNA G18 (ribose-2'-O)-methylase SpoU